MLIQTFGPDQIAEVTSRWTEATLCCSTDWSSSLSSHADKERSYEKEPRPKDIVQDEEVPYENEEECADAEPKEKSNVLPLVLEFRCAVLWVIKISLVASLIF
ncbi:Uncharacterized protein Fot_30041 [Forsythia ovata]|uniref:Uncharacterized protein n=1 Tax=Forsythia ovata TaxID=205694 RepID=A0ABD1TTL4_9LAMI